MKKMLIVLACASLASALCAADFADFGYQNRGEKTIDGVSYTILANKDGNELQFRSEPEPSATRLKALSELEGTLRSWKSLDIAAIRAVNESDRLILTVVPRKVEYNGQDLVSALPGGLVFYFVSAVEYDFRVKAGDYIVRIRGFFGPEGELMGLVESALKDPVAYLAQRDPQYAIRRMAEFNAMITDLQKADADQSATVKALRKALEDSQNSLMATMNKGFFGGPKPLNAAMVAKLVELKAASPALDRKGAAAALKAAGMNVSAKEIDIVFAVKFGESQ